jgi:hypothetical protein
MSAAASAVDPGISQLMFVAGAVWWMLPDRRLARVWPATS